MPPNLNIKSMELTLPFSFLKSTVISLQDESQVFSAKMNNNDCILHTKKAPIADKDDEDLTIMVAVLSTSVPKYKQSTGSGHLKFKITDICEFQKTAQTSIKSLPGLHVKDEGVTGLMDNENIDLKQCRENAMNIIPVSSGKRRGRPKNSTKSQEILPKLAINEICSNSGRYSLRGVKLSSKMMKLEKGLSDSDDSFNSDFESNCDQTDVNSNGAIDQFSSDKIIDKLSDNTMETIIINNTDSNITDKQGVSEKASNLIIGAQPSKFVSDQDNLKLEDVKQILNDDSETEQLEFIEKKRCFLCLEFEEFSSKKELKLHEIDKHSDLKCVHCGNDKTYKHMYSLKSHFLWTHGKNSLQKHMCHLCPSRFKFSNTLKQHIEEIHDKMINVQCKFCDKKFYRKSQLTRHEKIHGDAKLKLLCETCGKGFWHDSNRQRHIRIVHKQHHEQFHCSYCGKGFSQKSGMINHVKLTHLNLMNFKCSLCSLSFSKTKHFVSHMINVHQLKDFKVSEPRPTRFRYNRTPEDLLHCSKCDGSFCYKAELIEHMHIDHADSFPFLCVECNQGFLKRPFLNRHRKSVHEDKLTFEEEEEIVMSVSNEKVSYVYDEERVSYTGLTHIIDDNVAFLTNDSESRNDGNVTYKFNDNVTYVTSGNSVTVMNTDNSEKNETDVRSSEQNVTYVTNVEYESMEEVETSVNNSKNEYQFDISNDTEMTGEQVLIVEDGENTVHYVIHPSVTQNLGAEEINNLLMAAKQAATASCENVDPQVLFSLLEKK